MNFYAPVYMPLTKQFVRAEIIEHQGGLFELTIYYTSLFINAYNEKWTYKTRDACIRKLACERCKAGQETAQLIVRDERGNLVDIEPSRTYRQLSESPVMVDEQKK